ncbi:MAG: hypothetical protein ACKV2V_09395 [Blastocatellia bacterium]
MLDLLSARLEKLLREDRYDQDSRQSVYELAALVAEDFRVRKTAFTQTAAGEAPARYPEVKVLVRTTKERHDISDLRIYYVPKALRNNKTYWRSFDRKSSPADRVLPEATYLIWGARDPGAEPVTNEHLLEVRKNDAGKIEVELSVVK